MCVIIACTADHGCIGIYACWPGETAMMSVMVSGVRTRLLSLNDGVRRGRFVQGTRYVAAGSGRGKSVHFPPVAAIRARASASKQASR